MVFVIIFLIVFYLIRYAVPLRRCLSVIVKHLRLLILRLPLWWVGRLRILRLLYVPLWGLLVLHRLLVLLRRLYNLNFPTYNRIEVLNLALRTCPFTPLQVKVYLNYLPHLKPI